MAYILGFMYADGNIVQTKRGNHYVAIYTADKQLLIDMADCMDAKQKIFAPPFDRSLLAKITTGILYSDTVKGIENLRSTNSHYRYGVQKVESVERFAASGSKATIEVRVTEDATVYRDDRVETSSFNTRVVRYTLEYSDGIWKIADSQIMRY